MRPSRPARDRPEAAAPGNGAAGPPDIAAAADRDQYLCFCETVTHQAFRGAVWEHRDLAFEEVCRKAKVGLKCTACLLNAETLYVDALQSRPRGFRPGDSGLGIRDLLGAANLARWRRQAFAYIDRRAPMRSTVQRQNLPILAGPGVRTVLCVSNAIPGRLGPRSARFEVRCRRYAADGRMIDEATDRLDPGERLDRDVSAGLEAGAGAERLATGSCELFLRNLSSGFRGSIRPHFKVQTPRAVTAVHTQRGSPGERHFVTGRGNAAERQLVSVINVGPAPGTVAVGVRALDRPDDARRLEVTLPGYGAELVELPLIEESGRPLRGIYDVSVASEIPIHRHIVVCGEGFDRISVDHL